MNKTRVRYFEQEDVFHLAITEEPESRSLGLSPDITVELNDKDEMIGVEILNASKLLRDTVSSNTESPDMLPEYQFDYSQARPNRFAGKISEERLVVALDPEVSKVFTTAESVNAVLRALVAALPEGAKRKAIL